MIVPARNEGAFIGRCLSSLAAQDYPPDRLEVIIADGRSSDSTRAVAEAFAERAPFDVRVVDNPGRVTASGLNAGIHEAKGDVIAYVLAHGEVASGFVRRSVEALARTGADVVGPPITTTGQGPMGTAFARAVSSPFGVGRALFRYSEREEEVDTVAFAAYRRDVFDRIGLFDEGLVGDEDSEFHFRLRAAGGRIMLVPSIGATYFARESTGGLARQYFAFGAAKAETLRRYPKRIRPWHLAPALFAATLAFGALGRRARRPAKAALAAYALANGVASIAAGRRDGFGVVARLPLAFGTIHLAYGAGSWMGALGLWRPRAPRPRE